MIRDILIAALVIAGGIYFLIAIGSTSSPPHQSVDGGPSLVPIASDGRLNNGYPAIAVAIDAETVSEILQGGDLSRPSLSGRVFVVTGGTLVRVTESGLNSQRVRILSGPQKGRTGWVPLGWIKLEN